MSNVQPEQRERDLYPLLYNTTEYTPTPLASLAFDSVVTSLIAPYCLAVYFFSNSDRLIERGIHDDALAGRNILPDDLLIFDHLRVEPQHDAVQLVADGERLVARVCTVLADGWVEFRAAAEGYPILSGERRIYGTLAAVVRATDGRPSEEEV